MSDQKPTIEVHVDMSERFKRAEALIDVEMSRDAATGERGTAKAVSHFLAFVMAADAVALASGLPIETITRLHYEACRFVREDFARNNPTAAPETAETTKVH